MDEGEKDTERHVCTKRQTEGFLQIVRVPCFLSNLGVHIHKVNSDDATPATSPSKVIGMVDVQGIIVVTRY